MWAVGTYDFRLTDDEFWGCTALRFDALRLRWEEDQARRDRRSGEVVAALLNVHRDPKKQREPFGWLDVYPHHRRQQPLDGDAAYRRFHAWAMIHNARLKVEAQRGGVH